MNPLTLKKVKRLYKAVSSVEKMKNTKFKKPMDMDDIQEKEDIENKTLNQT